LSPYTHDGSFATLDEVIEFDNRGGRVNPFLDHVRPLGPSDVRNRRCVSSVAP
jgi:hypothetical protein